MIEAPHAHVPFRIDVANDAAMVCQFLRFCCSCIDQLAVKTATGSDPEVKEDLGEEKEPAADDEEPAVQSL